MRRYRGLQIAEFCTQVLVLLSKLADISFLCAKFILPELREHIKHDLNLLPELRGHIKRQLMPLPGLRERFNRQLKPFPGLREHIKRDSNPLRFVRLTAPAPRATCPLRLAPGCVCSGRPFRAGRAAFLRWRSCTGS